MIIYRLKLFNFNLRLLRNFFNIKAPFTYKNFKILCHLLLEIKENF